jgi:protein ImuB
MFACLHAPEHAAAPIACAQTFSPRVEATAPGTATMDAAGLERLYGGAHEIAAAIARRAAESGMRANVAIAANPDTAVCAARGFAGVSVVPAGDEAKFLGPLPLSVLEPSPEIAATLARWGIRRFRDLAALPARGLVERLGPEGVRLHRLARGVYERPLAPLEETPEFAEELELEHAVEQLEPLSFLLARLLNGIVTRLGSRALAANELRLRLKLEQGGRHERTLRMPVPMLDARAFLKLMQLDLEAHPPGAAIVHVRIEASPVKPRAAQAGLFIPLAPEPEKLEVTLARLAALAGEGNVGTPELLDTHRPDAFRMRRFGEAGNGAAAGAAQPAGPRMALRVFRPARFARVEVVNGRPGHVHADGVRGSVVASAGPWSTSGDWWTRKPWARDEWDVALSGGALYRLVCEHATGRWFLEGSYD